MAGLLEGLRVIEVALLAPDVLGMHLADLGADVVKVEEPGLGDYVRLVGKSPDEPVSALHRHWNRGKRSIALDLRQPRGAEVFLELVAGADAVIEGLRPGALARRGLGYEDLRAVNPRLVFLALSGFGQSGPYRDLASHGVAYDAYGGLADPRPGPEGWPCIPHHVQIGIAAGPLYAAMALLAGVLRARSTGEGCCIDVAEADAAAHWQALRLAADAATEERAGRGERRGLRPPPGLEPGQDPFEEDVRYQYYETADGRHVLFMASERKFWENFAAAVGRPDLAVRYPSAEVGDHQFGNRALRAELVELFATRTQADWVALFLAADVPGAPVNVGPAVRHDPHFRARARWLDAAAHGMPMLGTPVRTDIDLPDPAPAPALGQHTDEVLRDVLGYDGGGVAELAAAGALGPLGDPPA